MYIPFEISITNSCSSIVREIVINNLSPYVVKNTEPILLMTGPTGQDLLWCPEDVVSFVLKDLTGAFIDSSHPD